MAVTTDIPKADFKGGEGGGAVLPFGRDELADAGAELIVHFKVASNDPETIRRTAGVIERQMADQKIGARALKPIITGDDVEMTVATKQSLAALITPIVLRTAGFPQPKFGV